MALRGLKGLLLLSIAVQSASAHSIFSSLFVNGVSKGDGTCIRMNPDNAHANNPIPDVAGSDMACGVGGLQGVKRVCNVPDAAELAFEWRSWGDDPSQVAIDPRHYGPCSVYLKRVDSAIQDSGEGDGWFKIWDEGYDQSTNKWCNQKLVDNNGLMTVKLPPGLAGGYYLVRPELLALHFAPEDPQFYTGCAQIFLKSSGTKVAAETVSIPGYVAKGQPALSFLVNQQPYSEPYPLPGPKKAELVDGDVSVPTRQTEGRRPKGCVIEDGNWCGKPLPQYSDEDGCWKSADACWDQQDACWDQTQALGGKGCEAWNAYCEAVKENCSGGNPSGPPPVDRSTIPVKTKLYQKRLE